ncbi:MAG: serine/threonine protein kinase [Bdellovibrionia bacterium]
MSQNFEQFGKYILLEKLAAGGMAEVYFAKSTGAVGVSKFIAIKRILPQFSENPEFVDMFKEEAKLAVNLNHSNIVTIFDFGVERGQFYIVMDYVEGKNLRQVTTEFKKQNRALSIEDVVYVIKEAAAGLDHAHRCVDAQTGKPLNIIHRDISPQNIMVSYEGEVKLIDFGIAKAETQMEATKAGTLKGKYGYMSPEQAEGQNVDARTDVFALGIVLWELLANEKLFTASNEVAILNKIRTCQIPPIRKLCPNVPLELEKIVNKALAKDRALRYESAAALHRDLNRFLNMEYPDFSPQEFSKTLKNSFADDFLAVQKKRIAYSKVQGNSPEEKTQMMKTITDIRYPQNGFPADIPAFEPEEPGIELNTSTNLKVDLSQIPSTEDLATGIHKTGIHTKTKIPGQTAITNLSTLNKPQIPKAPPLKKVQEPSSNWLTPVLVAIFTLGTTYLAWEEGYLDKLNLHRVPVVGLIFKKPITTTSSLQLNENNPNTADTVNTTDMSSATPPTSMQDPGIQLRQVKNSPQNKTRLIYLKSTPTNAQIIVNGKVYPGRTPSHVRINMEPGREDIVVVSKEGFSNQVIRFKPTDQTGIGQDQTLSIALEPEIKARVVIRNAVPYDVQVYIRRAGSNEEAMKFKLGVNGKITTSLTIGFYEVRIRSELFGDAQLSDLEVAKPRSSMEETYYEIKDK